MSAPVLSAVARLGESLAPAPDAALLARFVADRDQAAFAALVKRHGPMVLGVCRRLLGDSHLAEDAFQAAFLVLARKAAVVRPADALAGWLHGVARTAALDARRRLRRRAARETLVPTVPDTPSPDPDAPDRDLLARLDRELARLPDRYRTAVVLCELEGRSRREAARLLGIPEGTLSSRLAQARKRLAARLVRPGAATAAVPAALVSAAVRAAVGPVPSSVAALAAGVCRMMLVTRLKLLALAVAGLALLATGGLSLLPGRAAEPAARTPPRLAAWQPPAPKPADEGRVYVWLDDEPFHLKPDGSDRKTLKPAADLVEQWRTSHVRWSPKAGRVAYVAGETFDPQKGLLRGTLTVRPDTGAGPPLELAGIVPGWHYLSADGRRAYLTGYEADAEGTPTAKLGSSWVFDLRTRQRAKLDLPGDHFIEAVSPDGRLFVTGSSDGTKEKLSRHTWLTPLGGSPVELFAENEYPYVARFSPDGRRLLVMPTRYGKIVPQGGGKFALQDSKNR
jgi:RNA polymerase sigma factor (sigma-70 family)